MKDARFDTRLSQKQKEYFELAAELGGYRSFTDFVVLTLQEKSKEIIQEHEQIIASEKDSELFFNALMNPPAPNQKLKKAVENFNSKINS